MPNDTVKLTSGPESGRQPAEKNLPPQPNRNAGAAVQGKPQTPPAGTGDFEKRAVEIRRRLENFLQGRNYYFNHDPEIVASILKAMAKRYQQFGADYCPCRRVTGDKEKDALIICPCVYHEEEVRVDGHCHCQLFTRT